MARFYGKIGYGVTEEDPSGSGVHIPVITERECYGDVLNNVKQVETGDKVNSDFSLGNSFSIVADQYATEHYSNIKYLWWEGARWTVTSVTVQRPRLILETGGVYNGPSL